MPRHGRMPLPANVHKLRGNPSKLSADRLNGEINPRIELPKPPKFLSAVAKREWRRVGSELVGYGLMSELDRAALMVYCVNYARFVQVEEKLKALGEEGLVQKTPSGYEQISPWKVVADRCSSEMLRYMAEFGMTPSARTRLRPSNNQIDLFDDGAENESSSEQNTPARFFDR